MPSDILESLRDSTALLEPPPLSGQLALEPLQLGRELALLLGEEVGADLTCVVQLEQLTPPLPELTDLRSRPAVRQFGGSAGRHPHVPANRILERIVPAHQPQSEEPGPLDALHRPPRLITPRPTMNAPVEAPPLPVAVYASHSPTQPAAHHAGEGMTALPLAARNPTPLSTLPLLLGHNRSMSAREPIAPPHNLA
ncbi:MAG: hypothetical protein WEA29_06875 [Acidimicrobiia bacterium]